MSFECDGPEAAGMPLYPGMTLLIEKLVITF